MSHDIALENGYLGRESAWHKLGSVKGDFLTRQDINDQGITFTAEKHQLERKGQPIKAWGVFHSDGTFIATCGEDYAIHPPAVVFDTMDELISAANHGSKYETAGIIGTYNKVWGLVDLKASFRVGDDETKQYLLGATSFDGSISTSFRETDVRVVCANTLQQALSKKTENALRIRHTSKSHRRLDDAREALKGVKSDFMRLGEKMNFLANRYANPVDIKNILDAVIAQPVAKSEAMAKVMENRRRENILNDIIELYEFNDNNAFPEQRGSAYNLLNAITGYVDHNRSTRTSDGEDPAVKRSISAVMGDGAKLKTRALEYITEYAGGMSVKPVRQFITAVPDLPGTPLLDSILDQV